LLIIKIKPLGGGTNSRTYQSLGGINSGAKLQKISQPPKYPADFPHFPPINARLALGCIKVYRHNQESWIMMD